MYVLIEVRSDEFDTYCKLKGSFRSKKKATDALNDLYEAAKRTNTEYEVFDSWSWFDMARIEWNGIPDRYEWYVFEASCKED